MVLLSLAALVDISTPTGERLDAASLDPFARVQAVAPRKPASGTTLKPPTEPARNARPRTGGREFETLDAYLDHLKNYAGPMDRPWYREVRPDVYKLETGVLRTSAPPRFFTREELERRFGFRQ